VRASQPLFCSHVQLSAIMQKCESVNLSLRAASVMRERCVRVLLSVNVVVRAGAPWHSYIVGDEGIA
jgi:hypothetical protein